MDEITIESLEPLESAKPDEVQSPPPEPTKPWWKKALIPGIIAAVILVILGIYFIFFSGSEFLVAQPLAFEIASDTPHVIISIANRGNGQAIVAELYPVFFGNDNSSSSTRPITATVEGGTLPLVINPNEERIVKLIFHVTEKNLEENCGPLTDSSHAVVFKEGPPKGQSEGYLGVAWKATDSDGKSFANSARLLYFTLIPSPPGSKDSTSLIRSGLTSTEPIELLTEPQQDTETPDSDK